jgi:hypothetical protein
MDTPYTYPTTYNPETWQTVDVAGTVDFTPGDIVFTLTYLIDNVPTPESVECTPPSGVAALDTTNVVASGPTPSFQVPPTVPPLQSQVTDPLDAGWAIQITNTSTVDVNGVSAAITAHGAGTLTYDLAGMGNTGTDCTSSGPNMATCDVGTLPEGATDTLNVLVETNGLANGTSITGSVNVTSSNASAKSSSLGGINVVVVQNGAEAVAVPTVPVISLIGPLAESKPAKVRLTLPATVPTMGLFGQTHGGAAKTKGPPVSMTLQALPGSEDPELCPPVAGGCEGDIMEITGNFADYTSKADPIEVAVKIFYGASVPPGLVYFQDTASSTPELLTTCVETGGKYNTPCVDGHERTVGTPGSLASEDTVFFTGNDPLVGRR